MCILNSHQSEGAKYKMRNCANKRKGLCYKCSKIVNQNLPNKKAKVEKSVCFCHTKEVSYLSCLVFLLTQLPNLVL